MSACFCSSASQEREHLQSLTLAPKNAFFFPKTCYSDSKLVSHSATTLTYRSTSSFDQSGEFETADKKHTIVVQNRTRALSFEPIIVYRDDEDSVVAVSKGTMGLTEDTYVIYRGAPSYEGQAPERDPTHGLDDVLGSYYPWAEITTKRGLTSAVNEFRCFEQGGSPDAPKRSDALYRGVKLSAMEFLGKVSTASGDLVGKSYTTGAGCRSTYVVEVASHADMIAIICTAAALQSNAGGTTGALSAGGLI